MNRSEAGRVLVIGAGTMGAGIAQSMVAAGATVVLADQLPQVLDSARERIRVGLARGWRDHAEVDDMVAEGLERLSLVTQASGHDEIDLVIEAVPESLDLKRRVIAGLSQSDNGRQVVASNTSSMSIDTLAESFVDPTRFIGMHFFNPVPASKLVEIVVGTRTSALTLEATRQWVQRLDKTAIEVHDSPGFATSRLGLALGLEAIRMVEEGVASAEDIDTGMVLGYRHPMGPLKLTDLVGLDVRLGIAEHLASVLGPRFEPPALLRDMVAAGKLGQKSGEGFYRWP